MKITTYQIGRKSKTGKNRGSVLLDIPQNINSLAELRPILEQHPQKLKKIIGKKNYVDWNNIFRR